MFFKGNHHEEENRFVVKSFQRIPDYGRITVFVDTETGVHYIHTWMGQSGGLTPLLDENGEVVVEKPE
ncbi:hypothetical protein E2491_13410 [Jeotgalibacillus sp. R-1-5s-1]|nr:hypothetical protein E2491_13410 [Jeotgalibacillus sp. R-1-5s-1]